MIIEIIDIWMGVENEKTMGIAEKFELYIYIYTIFLTYLYSYSITYIKPYCSE